MSIDDASKTGFRPSKFDSEILPRDLDETLAALPSAMACGRELAGRVDRVRLVACRSPDRAMRGMSYWLEHFSPTLEMRRYFPAEVMAQDPRRLDAGDPRHEIRHDAGDRRGGA